jgi:hypothetical protein
MKEITPSQFIEALLESQRTDSRPPVELKVRAFNNMVDQLSNIDICVQFGFSDLVEFVESFEESLSYKDFAIHISYTESLFSEIKKYNQIYAAVENFTEINKVVWKILKK